MVLTEAQVVVRHILHLALQTVVLVTHLQSLPLLCKGMQEVVHQTEREGLVVVVAAGLVQTV
jgi:hypothetical protein